MARERIASTLGAHSDELVFTGSGTEANNLAIRGVASALRERGNHIVTSRIEHSSVLRTCQALEREGFDVTYLGVDSQGHVAPEELSLALQANTTLVSLGYVNNEVGTVQQLDRLSTLVKARGIVFHTDAVQALPYFALDLASSGADLMSFSGHKLYAPKGVGLLYVRRGTPLTPIVFGGEQEFGLRSGTENVPYVVGFSRAVLLNAREKTAYVQKLLPLRDRLLEEVPRRVPDTLVTGDKGCRAPNHASFVFRGVNGKMLVKALSHAGIEVSSGAACSSPRNDASHVIKALGVTDEYLFGSLRITLGRDNTKRDVERVLRVLPEVVARMRQEGTCYENGPAFISQEEFQKRLQDGSALQVLDVRPVRIPRFEVPGSIRIPSWRLRSQLHRLDRSREIVVVCYEGDGLSPEALELLVKHGFTKVRVLKGGIYAYRGAAS